MCRLLQRSDKLAQTNHFRDQQVLLAKAFDFQNLGLNVYLHTSNCPAMLVAIPVRITLLLESRPPFCCAFGQREQHNLALGEARAFFKGHGLNLSQVGKPTPDGRAESGDFDGCGERLGALKLPKSSVFLSPKPVPYLASCA